MLPRCSKVTENVPKLIRHNKGFCIVYHATLNENVEISKRQWWMDILSAAYINLVMGQRAGNIHYICTRILLHVYVISTIDQFCCNTTHKCTHTHTYTGTYTHPMGLRWFLAHPLSLMMMLLNSVSGRHYRITHICPDVHTPGIIVCMRPANERWRYTVTPSLIGWARTQNEH